MENQSEYLSMQAYFIKEIEKAEDAFEVYTEGYLEADNAVSKRVKAMRDYHYELNKEIHEDFISSMKMELIDMALSNLEAVGHGDVIQPLTELQGHKRTFYLACERFSK